MIFANCFRTISPSFIAVIVFKALCIEIESTVSKQNYCGCPDKERSNSRLWRIWSIKVKAWILLMPQQWRHLMFNAPSWKPEKRCEANTRMSPEFCEFHPWNFISPVHIETILSSFWYFVLEIVIVCIILDSTESRILRSSERRPTLGQLCHCQGR